MIKALENLSNRITVNYEEKPCYHIVFSDSFTNLLEELEKFNIKNRKLCIVTESKVGPLYGEELLNLLKPHCRSILRDYRLFLFWYHWSLPGILFPVTMWSVFQYPYL